MQKQSPLLSVLSKASNLLIILAVGLGLLIVYHFFAPQEPVLTGVNTGTTQEKTVPAAEPDVPIPGDFEPNRALFQSRDIFAAPYEKELIAPAAGTPVPEPTGTPTVDLSEEFKVVGIVIDQDESQAVVLNIQERETLFLTVGDKLGEATLKAILPDRVIFQQSGKDVELIPQE